MLDTPDEHEEIRAAMRAISAASSPTRISAGSTSSGAIPKPSSTR
jgi:hypothetical protein